jgi:adenosylmethionine---8-amino-7-oxononanoate aminotransferase
VAVEVAMKLALQYWVAKQAQSNTATSTKSTRSNNPPFKSRFLTVRNGYHGDTFMAMSVCDYETGMHSQLFPQAVTKQYFCDAPTPTIGSLNNDNDYDATTTFDAELHLRSMKQLLEDRHDEIAAVILEPIVQGAGGMRFYDPRYLYHVRQLCTHYDVLLICDEIATGFGRTGGHLFACRHADIVPDILCLGKALSGGYVSFAATLCRRHVVETLNGSGSDNANGSNVLMHGPTFMANPLACAVSLASLELLLQPTDANQPESNRGDHTLTTSMPYWQGAVAAIEAQLRLELEPCRESPLVKDVRVLGAIGVVEFHEPIAMRHMQPALVHEHGVWLRPFGRLLYTMPPYMIARHELKQITSAMVAMARRRF